MFFQTALQFKPIKTNTYEKERERKLEDQEKWRACFDRIVGSYFENNTFNGFHEDFNPLNDRLDCSVPSPGTFKCQQFGEAGQKKTTKTIDSEEEVEETAKTEGVEKKKNRRRKFPQNGCGRNWSSNLCLTKFVCRIEEKNNLVVELREYGQRCEHCTKRYENPSFKSQVLEIMIKWLLSMIVEGIFDVIDQQIQIDPDDLGFFRTGQRQYIPANNKKTHDSERCEACIENKGCGLKKKVKKQRKRRNRGRGSQQQQQ